MESQGCEVKVEVDGDRHSPGLFSHRQGQQIQLKGNQLGRILKGHLNFIRWQLIQTHQC